MKSKQKTSRCKREQLITKTGLAEKDVKSKWVVKPYVSSRIKSFDYDKHYYFRCSRASDDDGIKISDKEDWVAVVLWPVFLPKIWSHQYQETLSTLNNNVLQEVKTFHPIKSRRFWLPILIWHLYQQGLFWFLATHLQTFGLDRLKGHNICMNTIFVIQ